MSGAALELLQGTLDTLVLKALEKGPEHGYAVARWIREASDEALRIEDGALYAALHRMEERGWLVSRWGRSENNRRARFYRLTASGRRQLARGAGRWERYARAVSKVLEGKQRSRPVAR